MADQPQHDLLPRRTSKREEGGVFLKKERERGTREGAGKLKRGKVFFEQRRGERERSKRKKGAKGPSNAKTRGR
jgi:hypothetical protein